MQQAVRPAAAGGIGKKTGARASGGRRKSTPGGATAPKTVAVTVKRRARDPERANPNLRAARLDGNAAWAHDMHKTVASASAPPAPPRAPSVVGTKLYIGNLDYRVSNEDIKELFSTVGPLSAYQVHVDNQGRSKGTAEVIYADRKFAADAQKRYNSIELDGRPMKIELIEKQSTLKSGIKVTTWGGRVIEVPRNKAQALSSAAARGGSVGGRRRSRNTRANRGGGNGGGDRMMMD